MSTEKCACNLQVDAFWVKVFGQRDTSSYDGFTMSDSVRLDVWLWSVRVFKTRSMSTSAVRGGKVRVNGEHHKASYGVKVGDEVRVRIEGFDRVLLVKQLLSKRVGAPLAAVAYQDQSPPRPAREFVAPSSRRDRGLGRPTKRDRREIDRLLGRDREGRENNSGLEHLLDDEE